MNIHSAVERRIRDIACQKGLMVDGLKPTGFHDVMAMVNARNSWRGPQIKTMQQFIYQAKYGEFKKSGWNGLILWRESGKIE
jgi:hypothetical protein